MTDSKTPPALSALLLQRVPIPTTLRRDVLATVGISDNDIRTRFRRDDWRALRPGRYLQQDDDVALHPEARHRCLVTGLVPDLKPGSVVGSVSAAVMMGIPLWRTPLRQIHVVREQGQGVRSSRWIHVHRALGPIPTILVDGIAVTSPARTVVDCARMLPFEQGVVIADAALHAGITCPAELEQEVSCAVGLKGVGRARAVVAFADSRSESPGESRSRVLFSTSGLPPRTLQHDIPDHDGQTLGRVDFAIPDLRIAGEFDGKIKYGRLLRPGQSPGDAIFEEKVREDAIRDAGWEVVRWVWSELETPRVIVDRWMRAVARARGRV